MVQDRPRTTGAGIRIMLGVDWRGRRRRALAGRTVSRSIIGFLLLSVTGAVAAEEIEITPRRTNDYDEKSETGYCLFKVTVDIEVNVTLQKDRVTIQWSSGQPSEDLGTECSQPLPPASQLLDFVFRGVSGRGKVKLAEQPTEDNGGRTTVNIKDSKGGKETHVFRLDWRAKAGSG